MNPISLRIKGLNSFIQEKFIDFNELTEEGLFGIVGPKGSGKSTILDAICLALYGENVKGTQNFISTDPAVEEAKVVFEFSMNNIVYKVERTFIKEFPNIKVIDLKTEIQKGLYKIKLGRVAMSNLTDPSKDGSVKDTKKDVNAKCFEILKMTKIDFLRTVMSPQGENSSVLNLTGATRTNMLERLFNLEEYGKSISDNLKTRKGQLNLIYQKVNSYISGMSTLSSKTPKELKIELEAIEIEVKKLNDEAYKIAQQYEIINKSWSLQEEIKSISDDMSTLEKQRSLIEEIRAKIELCKEAKSIKTFLDDKIKYTNEYTTTFTKLESIEKELVNLKSNEAEINKNYKDAELDKDNKIPSLNGLKIKLENALEDEKTLKVLQKQLDELVVSINDKETEKSGLVKENEVHLENQKTLKAKQDDLKNEIVSNTVSSKIVDSVGKCKQYLSELENLNDKLKDKLESKREIGENQDSLNEDIKTSTDLVSDLNNKIGSLSIASTDESDTQKLNDLKTSLEDNKKLSQQNEINKYVSTLKDVCKVGEDCPVCGKELDCIPEFCDDDGVDYNKIISDIQNEIDDLQQSISDKKIAQAEEKAKLNAELNAAKDSIDKTNNSIETNKQILKKLQDEIVELENKVSVTNKDLEQLKSDNEIGDIEELSEQIAQKYSKKLELEGQQNENLESLNAVTDTIIKITSKISNFENEISSLNATFVAKKQEKDTLNDKLQKDVGVDCDISTSLTNTITQINNITNKFTQTKVIKDEFDKNLNEKETEKVSVETVLKGSKKRKDEAVNIFESKLLNSKFANEKELEDSYMEDNVLEDSTKQVNGFDKSIEQQSGALKRARDNLKQIQDEHQLTKPTSEKDWEDIQQSKKDNNEKLDIAKNSRTSISDQYENAKQYQAKYKQAADAKVKLGHQLAIIKELSSLFQGKKFVDFAANNKLIYIAFVASGYLKEINEDAYELIVDDNNDFLIKDANSYRPTSTLSGGETFEVALALGLALSAEVQTQAKSKIELFLLDEGFGTLDDESIDYAMQVIKKINNNNMKIGIITHVDRVKEQLPVKLEVTKSLYGKGSEIAITKVDL